MTAWFQRIADETSPGGWRKWTSIKFLYERGKKKGKLVLVQGGSDRGRLTGQGPEVSLSALSLQNGRVLFSTHLEHSEVQGKNGGAFLWCIAFDYQVLPIGRCERLTGVRVDKLVFKDMVDGLRHTGNIGRAAFRTGPRSS